MRLDSGARDAVMINFVCGKHGTLWR